MLTIMVSMDRSAWVGDHQWTDGDGRWIGGFGLAVTVRVYGRSGIFNVYMLKMKKDI